MESSGGCGGEACIKCPALLNPAVPGDVCEDEPDFKDSDED